MAKADYPKNLEDILVDGPGEDFVLTITLNRPKAYNALRTRLLGEIADVLGVAGKDDNVRAVVLTGGSKVFAAGADITEMKDKSPDEVMKDPRAEHWASIRDFPKPIVAAVNGFCLGGGNELAMHCDIVIAGRKAQFGQPEVNLGIMPGAGGTQRLTHLVGKSKAMQLVLTGAFMSAEEAHNTGLVAEVTEPELTGERAHEIASTIAQKGPLAIQAAKAAVLAAQEMPLSEGLKYEREKFAGLFDTEDKDEGVAAFLEKRKPAFKGK